MARLGQRLREAKSIRAFAFEVLIVVVGVLIALAAQQVVEDWSWRQKVAAGEQRLKDEADDTVYAMAEQIMVAPCVAAQLQLLDEKLRAPGPWTGTEAYPSPIVPMVVRSPSRPIPTETWDVLGAEGTALRFDKQVALRTAGYYEQVKNLGALMRENGAKTAELNLLSRPTTLSPDARADLLAKINAIRYASASQGLIAVQAMAALERLGRLKPSAEIEAEMGELRMSPTSTIAVCEQRGLPLGNWEALVEEQVAAYRAMDERLKTAPK